MLKVRDIADILNVSEETVRRWLRSGKIIGQYTNKKNGYMVEKEEFERFISESKKYGMDNNSEANDRADKIYEIRKSLALIRNELNKICILLEES